MTFNKKSMTLLNQDILILPIVNVTGEELSHLLMELVSNELQKMNAQVSEIKISVSSNAGQAVSATKKLNANKVLLFFFLR